MSVGDGPRTGDETRRFRAFYDWPAPVEFDAVLPDDLDGPGDERQFLLDEAPFARQRAVRVEPAVLPRGVTPVATNPPTPGLGQDPSGNDGSGDLRADLADRINRAWEEWNRDEVPGWRQEFIADAIVEAGYRRLVDDDTTVDRLAIALHEAGCGCGMSLDEHQASMRHDFDEEDPAYADMARAAVRALREDT